MPTGEAGVVVALFDAATAVVAAVAGLSLDLLFLAVWYCCLEDGEPLPATPAEGYLWANGHSRSSSVSVTSLPWAGLG